MLNDQTITITELRARVQGGEARVGELLGLVAEYERKASHYQDDIHALSDKVTTYLVKLSSLSLLSPPR